MLPFFMDGDVLTLGKIAYGKISINDVITFKKGTKLITHRVLYKTPKYLITKGDNNVESDGKVYPQQILGKVKKVKRDNEEFDLEQLYLLQSTLYFQEIIKIKKLFEKENIKFVFLKGLPLHLYYEKSHPRRLYADCDILIDKKDESKVKDILLRKKYTTSDNSLSKTHSRLKDKTTQTSYYRYLQKYPVVFDIHTEAIFTITQLGSLDQLYSQKTIAAINERFLQNISHISIYGEKFPFLTPEYLILFLCHHLFRDNFRGSHKYDLLRTVIIHHTKKNQLQWDHFIALTDSAQLTNIVLPCFVLMNRYYPDTIPSEVMRKLRVSKRVKRFIETEILETPLFDSQGRIQAGINRFKNQFILSPYPLTKRLLVFIQPKVVYTICWIFYKRVVFTTKQKLSL